MKKDIGSILIVNFIRKALVIKFTNTLLSEGINVCLWHEAAVILKKADIPYILAAIDP